MATLSDLTLKQLVAAYIGLTGIEVGPKFFNSRRTGVRRLEALIAEKNLTLADVLKAAGIAAEAEPTDTSAQAEPAAPVSPRFPALDNIEADEDGCELEQVEDGDIPGTEDPPEPGMVWNELEQEWQYPEEDLSAVPDTAAPLAIQADPEPATPLPPTEDQPAPLAPETPDVAAILVSNRVINDTRDWLVCYLIDGAGLDPETAVLAALRAVAALKLPEPAARPEPAAPRQPRSGSKQDQVIALLRRPEGATLAEIGEATGWASHTCRGVLAGALKKRLGLTITSTKESGGQRTYRLAAS